MPDLIDDHSIAGAHLEAPQQRHAQSAVACLRGHAVSRFEPPVVMSVV
jgi:hypothetical protein